MKRIIQIVVAWLIKRLGPRTQKKPSERATAVSSEDNQSENAVGAPAEVAVVVVEGRLRTSTAGGSLCSAAEFIPLPLEHKDEAASVEETDGAGVAGQAEPCCGNEGAPECGISMGGDPCSEGAAANEALRESEKEPPTEETTGRGGDGICEAEGGEQAMLPSTLEPGKATGVGLGCVEPDTANAAPPAEQIATAFSNERGGTISIDKQISLPVREGGPVLVNGEETKEPAEALGSEMDEEKEVEESTGDPPTVSEPVDGVTQGDRGGRETGTKATDSAPVTEKRDIAISSAGAEAIALDGQNSPHGNDGIGSPADSDGAAGREKPPAPESEWEAYSERPDGESSKPQPEKKTQSRKNSEAKRENAKEEEATAEKTEREVSKPIDFSEYNGPGAGPLPDSYLWWNRILLQRFMAVATNGEVLLATTPRALAAAFFDSEDERVTPVDAEKRFAEAVAAAYKAAVIVSPARLKAFRRFSPPDGIPACVGILALSVLAAHKMHMDETAWSSDYYSRLAELLGVGEGANGQPIGFRGDEFESLWLFLAEWIAKKTGCSLVLPQGGPQKRFIAYPLAHVPLRQLDLEKLPAFFERAGYSSEIPPPSERLEDDLRRWDESYRSFSNAGRESLKDSRIGAVLTQVRSELKAWDGVVADSEGVRSSQVEILLETIGRRSSLALLAPRREGFPEIFSCGELQLSGGDSWYDPLELRPEDGGLLQEGFSWRAEDRPNCVLRRPAGLVFVLAPHAEYSDLVSRTGLPKDVTSAVLCHESLLPSVTTYLESICATPPRPFRESSLPEGWFLLLGVKVIRRAESVPENLRTLEVATEANIIPRGGLRIGGQWAWLEGAPPRLLIEGHDGRTVSVNGGPVELDQEGYIKAGELLASAGEFTIKVGSFEKKVRIVKARMRPSATPVTPVDEAAKVEHSIILEAGAWNLVGSFPGEIASAEATGLGSSLVFCGFEPAWAIKLGARKAGTRVIELARKTVELSVVELLRSRGKAIRRIKRKDAAVRWASAIRAADCRHPAVESSCGSSKEEAVRNWEEYEQIARAIKRLSKRGLL